MHRSLLWRLARAGIVASVLSGFGLALAAEMPAYPLKVSSNRRYLVDQKNVPFLIAGESPQAVMVNLSEAQADMFFANRAGHGFNTVWINLVCGTYTGGRRNGSTYDGILPFLSVDDLATPNPVYFERCDRMIRLAAKHGLLVMLDPLETGTFWTVMEQNGPSKCREYGRFLGAHYKKFDNILWFNGNDFSLKKWRNPRIDAEATAVAWGIKDKDKRHIHTVELNTEISSSLDDPNWAPIVSLCGAYSYYQTYAEVLKDYNLPHYMPVFMMESDYEFDKHSTPGMLRREEYWANLSGATGQMYGNDYTWPITNGWQTNLDSPGAIQMAYVKALFEPRAWFQLVPDQTHKVVVAGYGTFDGTATDGNLYTMTSDYVTAGRTPDGSLVMAFMPTYRPITVDMKQLNGPAIAQWYDPSCGNYLAIEGSPFANSGKHMFIPPRHNADGDEDWVLVLEAGRK